MGVFDPNYSRLKLIIMIALFLTCMYTLQGVLLATETHDIIVTPLGDIDINTTSEQGVRDDVKGLQGGLVDIIAFITFQAPNINPVFKTILGFIVVILDIILSYLIIDIAYDIIKALPFT